MPSSFPPFSPSKPSPLSSSFLPFKRVASVKETDWVSGPDRNGENLTISSTNLGSETSLEDDDPLEGQNLQLAQGKAGEDRVHVIISEEHGWVFVGIYDGFNGPDAPDYLVANLYTAVHKELKGLLWDDKNENEAAGAPVAELEKEKMNDDVSVHTERSYHIRTENPNCVDDDSSRCVQPETSPSGGGDVNPNSNSNLKRRGRRNSRSRFGGAAKKYKESQRRWKCEWDKERLESE